MWNAIYPTPQLFIDGQWLSAATSDDFRITSPATGKTMAGLAVASPSQVDSALTAAGKAASTWAGTTPYERAAILARAGRILIERMDTVASWLTLEQGKPLAEARAEVQAAADVFEWVSGECKRTYGRIIPSRVRRLRQTTEFEPVGPSALLSPWNFPIILPTRKVATALAAGCTCVLKPAEQTPASAMALVLACQEAGVPEGVVNLLTGDPVHISNALIANPIIKKVSLTGSVGVGRAVARLAGEHLKKCTLELGGHAPVIIMDDCDLEHAVATLVRTKYRNSGQVCVSPTRFIVQDGVASEFVDRFVAEAQRMVVGDGLEPETQMGPLTTARRLQAVSAHVEDARLCGARILAGGHTLNRPGFFYAPTVISDAPEDALSMQEEPFGPLALISRFGEADAAIAEANRLRMGLAAYLFTSNLERARSISAAIHSGMVGVNHVGFGLPETPMCGVGDSGYGHEGGTEGIGEFMVTKFVNEYAV